MHCHATYLRDDYILADAFRPQPGWGSLVTRADASDWPAHTDAEVIAAAKRGTPPGYWLQRIDAYGGAPHHREVLVRSVPLTRAPRKLTPREFA